MTQYQVICEVFDTSGIVEANSAQEAAIRWAADFDRRSANYAIMRRGDALVKVNVVDGGYVGSYAITGESMPSYYARPVRDSP
jgi:hypothetical protein